MQKREDRAYLIDGRSYQVKTEEANAEEEKSESSIFNMYAESSPNIGEGWEGFQNMRGVMATTKYKVQW